MSGASGVCGRVLIAVALAVILGVGAYFLDQGNPLRPAQSERNERLAGEVNLDPVERESLIRHGQELTAAHCCRCHGQDLTGGRVAGAAEDVPLATNLTRAGAAARYSKAEFCKILHERMRPDGRELNPIMPAVMQQQSAAKDAEAIWHFLQTLPADCIAAPHPTAH